MIQERRRDSCAGAGPIIAANMGTGDRLFAFDTTLAVEADRPLMSGLDMAQFSPASHDARRSRRAWRIR